MENLASEQVLFSLPLRRMEPIFKDWFREVLKEQPTSTPTPQTTNPEPVRLFGDRAAASYLGCSVMTIQSLRRNGNIPFYRTGRKIIYISNELDQALQVKARKFQKTK